MSHESKLVGLVIDAQMDMFRLAKRDIMDLKQVAAKSGIPYPNILYYASGKGVMNVVCLLKLRGVIPDALLSLLTAPVDAQIVSSICADDDHDTAADRCDNVASLVRKARHPASPEGVEIAECEERAIIAARKGIGA